MTCSQQSSGTDVPFSASLRIFMIWLSVQRDFSYRFSYNCLADNPTFEGYYFSGKANGQPFIESFNGSLRDE